MSKRKRTKLLSALIALAVTGTMMVGADTVYAAQPANDDFVKVYGTMVDGSEHNGDTVASVNSTYAIAIGAEAIAGEDEESGSSMIAIGYQAKALGDRSISIGRESSVTENYSVAIGDAAKATYKAVALGMDSVASNEGAVALGYGSVADKLHTVSVGNATYQRHIVNVDSLTAEEVNNASNTYDTYAVSVGTLNNVLENFSGGMNSAVTDVAFNNTNGNLTVTTTIDGTPTTANVDLDAYYASDEDVAGKADARYISINGAGSKASATGSDAIAIGADASATEEGAIAMGYDVKATANRAIGIGYSLESSGEHSIAMSDGAKATAENTIAMGYVAEATANNAIAMGYGTEAKGDGAIAMGYAAGATANNAIAMGYGNSATGNFAIAMGSGVKAEAVGAIAIGNLSAVATGSEYSMALGMNSEVVTDVTNAVALGYGSIANTSNTVSVGNDNLKRRIVNVANGTADNDAVNVSQLNQKANATDVYTKDEADTLLDAKANAADVYTKDAADALLADKANTADVNAALDTKANVTDVETLSASVATNTADIGALEETVAGKADKADTLAGYGITDAYTKNDVDSKINAILGTDDGSAPTTNLTEVSEKITNIEYNSTTNTTTIEGALSTDTITTNTITTETITTNTITTETITTTGDASLGNDGLKVDAATGDVTVKGDIDIADGGLTTTTNATTGKTDVTVTGDITAGGDITATDADGNQISLRDTEARVDTLEGDVATLKQSVGTDLTELKNRVTTAEGEIDTLQANTAGITRTGEAGKTGTTTVTDDFVVNTTEGKGKVTIGYIGDSEMLFTQNEAGNYTFGVNAETGEMQANGGAEFGYIETDANGDKVYNMEVNKDGVAIQSGMSVADGALTVESNGKTVMSVKDSNGSFTVNEIGDDTMFYGKDADGTYTLGLNAQTGGIDANGNLRVGALDANEYGIATKYAFEANNQGAKVNGNLQISAQEGVEGTGNLGVEGGITAGTDVVAQGHSLVETSKQATANKEAIGDRQYASTNYITAGDSLTMAAGKLDAQVKTNADAIKTNADNIGDMNFAATNYISDSTTLTGAVTTLDTQVKTNADNIATNKSNIETNTKDIATNKANIATNTANIAANTTAIGENRNAIIGLGQQLGTLDGRVDKVGAGAAALAALHPLDYDAENKLSFSAGVGSYGGATAGAVGAFYRPNEDVMFSIGGTAGNGENMVNAGVSFAIGKGSSGTAKLSKAALVEEVNAMKAENEALKEENKDIRNELNKLKAMVMELAAKK